MEIKVGHFAGYTLKGNVATIVTVAYLMPDIVAQFNSFLKILGSPIYIWQTGKKDFTQSFLNKSPSC